MDRLTELELFVKVAELGSLGGAAEALGLSNPAASRYLASLEARLSARLVERNTRRLYLTSEGQDFYERARTLLACCASVPRCRFRCSRLRRAWCATTSSTRRCASTSKPPTATWT